MPVGHAPIGLVVRTHRDGSVALERGLPDNARSLTADPPSRFALVDPRRTRVY